MKTLDVIITKENNEFSITLPISLNKFNKILNRPVYNAIYNNFVTYFQPKEISDYFDNSNPIKTTFYSENNKLKIKTNDYNIIKSYLEFYLDNKK